jgi:hypothetical protein
VTMPTVDDVQTRLACLQQLRAAGTLRVEIDGRVVQYKSDAEMAAAIADLQRQLLMASGASMVHTVRVAATKGLE